jgi:hypothetical protein
MAAPTTEQKLDSVIEMYAALQQQIGALAAPDAKRYKALEDRIAFLEEENRKIRSRLNMTDQQIQRLSQARS